jgi:glycosyltransferase involved in cell wall biosynthesis
LWANWNKLGQDRAAAKSLTFVNSELIYDEYREKALKVVRTRTTTLRSRDIRVSGCRPLGSPIRVLYIGRLDSGKGILDIAEAIRILVAKGLDVVLDLVGETEKGDPVLDELDRFATSCDLAHRIYLHGYKPLGRHLFQHYLDADFFVVATRGSEGFPRTIWEAMAHGTPVIATRVGSIPRTLRHGTSALLVDPQQPRQIAAAIETLMRKSDTRSRLVRGGFAIAQASTLERTTPRMIAEMEAFLAA